MLTALVVVALCTGAFVVFTIMVNLTRSRRAEQAARQKAAEIVSRYTQCREVSHGQEQN